MVVLALTAATLAAACGGASPSHGAGAKSTARRPRLTPASAPGLCTSAVAPAHALAGARTAMIKLAGPPFGIASTRDGRWSFVDQASGRLLVFSDSGGLRPRLAHTLAVPGMALGNALSADGRYLVLADGGSDPAAPSSGEISDAVVVSVARAEAGQSHAVLGTLRGAHGSQLGPIEAAISPDGHYAFVSIEYSDQVAVYDLRAALAEHFAHPTYIGSVPLGESVVGLAVSPDGRWLYATSEARAGSEKPTAPGTLSVISIARAGRDPAGSVLATVNAQCQPVRVVVSPDGSTVWVSARASNDLLAFSAAKLRSDPAHAMMASVRVGAAPVGLALVDGGRRVVLADSNRYVGSKQSSSLSVVDVAAALAGQRSVLGEIPAGAFPREMSLEGDGKTLLVGNFGSDQLEAVKLKP
jgi:DNA-binding beta-propeller fold protein YncE